ncbi:MAG: hypothetical protein RR321_05350 [Acidaminococcaceae bacterium]
MTEQEWQECVELASGGEWPIPRELISDYNNWLCRSSVGRALFFREQIEEAMLVLSTIVEVVPSEAVPASGMSEVEHKILCLRDLAKIVWGLTANAEAALRFWDEAVERCANWQHPFNSVARGEISYGRLVMLLAARQQAAVTAGVQAMITSERFEREQVNSYRYFGYKFMAEKEFALKNYQKAALLYEQAFAYYPKSAAGLRDEVTAKALPDAEERCHKFQTMSSMQYLQWDLTPAAVIRR